MQREQNLLSDEEEENEQAPDFLEGPKYISCTLPNKIARQRHFSSKARHSDTTSIVWERVNRVRPVLTTLFIFFFAIYCYIMIGQQPSKRAVSVVTHHNSDLGENCLELFKKNNCNLDRPVSEFCQHLRACIAQDRNTTARPDIEQTKILHLEEFLQNALLLLSGMGVIGVAHKIVKMRNWFRSVPSFIKEMPTYCRRVIRNNPTDVDREQNEN